jgi:hypothetical protein
MSESDIIEILKLLKNGIRNEDWDDIVEAKSYLEEYLNEIQDDDEDY